MMKMKIARVMAIAAVVAAVGIGTLGGGTEASAMSYSGYTPSTLGEACEMAYWYYFLR
jgi:hypothetical protein